MAMQQMDRMSRMRPAAARRGHPAHPAHRPPQRPPPPQLLDSSLLPLPQEAQHTVLLWDLENVRPQQPLSTLPVQLSRLTVSSAPHARTLASPHT